MAVECQINKIKDRQERYSQTMKLKIESAMSAAAIQRRGANEQRKQRHATTTQSTSPRRWNVSTTTSRRGGVSGQGHD